MLVLDSAVNLTEFGVGGVKSTDLHFQLQTRWSQNALNFGLLIR